MLLILLSKVLHYTHVNKQELNDLLTFVYDTKGNGSQ